MHHVVCPSGLSGYVRRIKGSELISIAEQIDGGDIDGFRSIVGACWIETSDPGPYPFVKGMAPKDIPWIRILQGDIMYVMIELRRISSLQGNTYEVTVTCPSCNKKQGKEVNVGTLLEHGVRKLSDEARAKIAAGGEFECELDRQTDELEVVRTKLNFKLQSYEQAERAARVRAKFGTKKPGLVDLLAAQTTRIDGKEVTVVQAYEFFRDLDWGALVEVQSLYAQHDCGVDTEVMFKCSNQSCVRSEPFAVDLPLDKAFFIPTPKSKKATTEE